MAVIDGGRSIVVGSEGRDQYLWKVAVPAAPPSTGSSTGVLGGVAGEPAAPRNRLRHRRMGTPHTSSALR